MTRKNREFTYRLKRRTDLSSSRTLTLGCFIAQSDHSDAHAVYLSIDRGRGEKTQLRLISDHAKIVDAWNVVINGTAILKSLHFSCSQTNDAITKTFISNLVKVYGEGSSDRGQSKLVGDSRVLLPWDGISFEAIKSPITKKWKIYRRQSNHPDFIEGMYAVGFSATEVLMIEHTGLVVISNNYILAGYLADYLNEKDHSEMYLAQSELDRLYAEVEKYFSVELKSVEIK
jgi:hypothetical protein